MPEQQIEFEVIDLRRHPSADPKRLGKWDRLVVYRLDEFHLYSIRVADEGFTEDTLRAAVKEDIAERAPWLGKKLRL